MDKGKAATKKKQNKNKTKIEVGKDKISVNLAKAESELEEIVDLLDKEEENFQPVDFGSETSINITEARAPVLEKVAEVRDRAILQGTFVPRIERDEEESLDYSSGREVEYLSERSAVNNPRPGQYQETQIDYNITTMKDEEQLRARKIMEHTGERISNNRGNEGDNIGERSMDIDTLEIEKSKRYMSRGDYK